MHITSYILFTYTFSFKLDIFSFPFVFRGPNGFNWTQKGVTTEAQHRKCNKQIICKEKVWNTRINTHGKDTKIETSEQVRGSSQKAKKFAKNDISTDEKVNKEKVIYRQVNQPEFLLEK